MPILSQTVDFQHCISVVATCCQLSSIELDSLCDKLAMVDVWLTTFASLSYWASTSVHGVMQHIVQVHLRLAILVYDRLHLACRSTHIRLLFCHRCLQFFSLHLPSTCHEILPIWDLLDGQRAVVSHWMDRIGLSVCINLLRHITSGTWMTTATPITEQTIGRCLQRSTLHWVYICIVFVFSDFKCNVM